MGLRIVPVSFRDACGFIDMWRLLQRQNFARREDRGPAFLPSARNVDGGWLVALTWSGWPDEPDGLRFVSKPSHGSASHGRRMP